MRNYLRRFLGENYLPKIERLDMRFFKPTVETVQIASSRGGFVVVDVWADWDSIQWEFPFYGMRFSWRVSNSFLKIANDIRQALYFSSAR